MNSHFKNKKILITGGAGFIGSNLCDHFLNLGSHVICLDNFITGNSKNINHLLKNPNFTLIEGDIVDYNTCLKSTIKTTYVLHQAALGSVPRSIEDPIMTAKINIDGFLNMLYASKENKVKRFVYAASSSTYGDSETLPKVEDKIGTPLSPYAITKYVNELYASNFNLIYNFKTIGLRYFNVFGRRQDPDGPYAAVIPKFIKKLINNEQPTINGDGTYSRDFTYINNVLLMNELALSTNNENALNNIYNTAFGQKTSLNEMFSLIKDLLSDYDKKIKNINPIYGPSRKGDIPHSLASIDKAKNLLNYYPNYSFKKGMKESIHWYWNNL
tara:strand:- start:17711 stop:18694 length:984 start_codon:yes stop_codon:yes gene_type:complete